MSPPQVCSLLQLISSLLNNIDLKDMNSIYYLMKKKIYLGFSSVFAPNQKLSTQIEMCDFSAPSRMSKSQHVPDSTLTADGICSRYAAMSAANSAAPHVAD